LSIYDTKKELLDALAEKFVTRVRPQLDGAWHEPYDESDLAEIWQNVFSPKGKNRKKSYKGSTKGLGSFPEALEHITGEPAELPDMVREVAEHCWPGYAGRIPVTHLKEFFVLMGWTEKKDFLPIVLPYPVGEYTIGPSIGEYKYGFRFCEISYIELYGQDEYNRGTVRELSSIVQTFSRALRIDPALAVAAFLCNLPAYEDSVAAIIDPEEKRITINVRHFTTPPQVVKTMYSLARARMVEILTGEPFTTFPRARVRSDRVSTLLEFVQDTKDMDWKQRWQIWQDKYPRWRYKTPNSMCAVYYRKVRPSMWMYAQSQADEESD
jgi:hypothetical protein